jgi:hypothetical protein
MRNSRNSTHAHVRVAFVSCSHQTLDSFLHCQMEQNDNDADIVRSLLFLMDSNIGTKNDDFKEHGEMIHLRNSSNDHLSQGSFSPECARQEVGLESTEIIRESEIKFASPKSSLPIERQDSFPAHEDHKSSDVPDPACANSDVSLCSLSVAVCCPVKQSISLYRDERGNCKIFLSPERV